MLFKLQTINRAHLLDIFGNLPSLTDLSQSQRFLNLTLHSRFISCSPFKRLYVGFVSYIFLEIRLTPRIQNVDVLAVYRLNKSCLILSCHPVDGFDSPGLAALFVIISPVFLFTAPFIYSRTDLRIAKIHNASSWLLCLKMFKKCATIIHSCILYGQHTSCFYRIQIISEHSSILVVI